MPDGTMAILIKEGEEMFNIYLLFRCSALGSYPYTVLFVTRLKQDLVPSYLCENDSHSTMTDFLRFNPPALQFIVLFELDLLVLI